MNALPGPSIAGAVPIVVLLVGLALDVWVYNDATARARERRPVVFDGFVHIEAPAMWLVGCLFFWIVFFPLYLVARNSRA